MRHIHLCFSSCATLLLLLLALNWRTSTGLPVPLSADNTAHCPTLFKSLLLNVTDLLKSNSSCMMLINSSFSENECVMNIMRDLAYYDTAIETYLKSPLHRPEKEIPLLRLTLGIIKDLRMGGVSLWNNSSYINRQKMCKMMRGFHVRAITINRAMGYISSGDHRK
ncbi:interleukin-12 subunit alpha [Anableps anableps]